MLPRFDTGHWSRYSLGGESTLHYQDYVIALLKLAREADRRPDLDGCRRRGSSCTRPSRR